MYIAFQGPGYGCCASTYRFITQTYNSDGATLASEFCHLKLKPLLAETIPRKKSHCGAPLRLWEKPWKNLAKPKSRTKSHMYIWIPGSWPMAALNPPAHSLPKRNILKLCNACFRLRILAEGTSCRKNFPEIKFPQSNTSLRLWEKLAKPWIHIWQKHILLTCTWDSRVLAMTAVHPPSISSPANKNEKN